MKIEITLAPQVSESAAPASIDLKTLKSFDDCERAINSIKNDPNNIVGGLKAYNSGARVTFKTAAANKMKAIEKLQDSFIPDED